MNWKNRLTNYNFWISMFSAVLLILQAFKIEFDILYINEILTAILGLLVVVGIISDPTRTSVKSAGTKEAEKVERKNEEIEIEVKNPIEQTSDKLPITEKDEVDNVNNENDFKAILNKISNNLDEKIKELEKLNIEASNKLASQLEAHNETEDKKIDNLNEVITPAVAEIKNPYIDVIN